MGNQNLAKIYNYNKLESLSNPKKDDYIGPFIHPSIKNFDKEIEDHFRDKSLIENNIQKMIQFKDRPCLGRRLMTGLTPEGKPIYEKKYTYFTFQEIHKMCKNVAKNLHLKKSEFIVEDEYDNYKFNLIGIFARNCSEWIITDMGCQMDSITSVTLYSTLGQNAFNYICEQTKIKTIFVTPDSVELLCNYKKIFEMKYLKNVVLFDLTTNCNFEEMKQKLENSGFICYSFSSEFLKDSSVKEEELEQSKPDTIMTVCYTSGTTGDPKGVMLTQRNLRCVLDTVIKDSAVPVDENSVHYSYLPLAHIFERMVISGFMSIAGRVGFISGSIKTTLMEDIACLHPTLLSTVPRVLQTVRTKVFDAFDELGGWKKILAYKAYNTKLDYLKKYGICTHALYDKLVFKKIRDMFGGQLKVILVASSPVPKELLDDFKVFLGISIVEGLGMTELAGSSFCTNYADLNNYTSGGVTTGARIKVKSVKDLGYSINDEINGYNCPAGELCIKGPLVFVGYYKNKKETEKSFDKEGYFHMGDVCRMFPFYGNGLKIVDRVKEIFKLSQGEYIVPAKLESIYSKSVYIGQIMIYGNSSMNNIIAIIKPDKSHCASSLRVSSRDIDNMEDDPRLKDLIIKDLLKYAEKANFNGLEKVKYCIITNEGFTIENACLTPTAKIVRKKVEKKFKDKIEELYASIPKA